MFAAAAAVVRRGVTIMRVEFSRVAVFLNDGFPPAHADGRRLIERGPPDPGEDSMLQFRPRASTRVFSSRLLPPPTLGERRQRGLTRRLVAVRAAYPLCGGRERGAPGRGRSFLVGLTPPFFSPILPRRAAGRGGAGKAQPPRPAKRA